MLRPRFVALEEEISNRFRRKSELAEGPVTLLQAMFKDVGTALFFLCSLPFYLLLRLASCYVLSNDGTLNPFVFLHPQARTVSPSLRNKQT